jgi:AcrR family transcriptional regulator
VAAKPHEVAHVEGQLSFLAEEAAPAPAAVTEALVPQVEEESEDVGVITGPNTRIRASNAMHRAREGAIRGALETIALRGLKGLTMVEAADRGGVARATLYNHARDKAALLELVLDRETREIARAFVEAPSLERALADAASAIAEHPALKGIREHDAAALVGLASASDPRVRRLAADALHARGCAVSDSNVDMALRWLASFVTVPSDRASREAQAGSLSKMLDA